MNYLIPLTYNLDIRELIDNYYYNEININNFTLYINKNYLIYKITSKISLENLLDFLYNYEDLVIKKIYYYLIIKYLINKKIKIKYEWYFNMCITNDWFDIYLKTREYYICHNNQIIITDNINYNICLIITNITIKKCFIAIIDRNCIIDSLNELIEEICINVNYEEIQITIIGGTICNIDIIIKIYLILKNFKLSKYINKTYLLKNKPLNRLKYDSNHNKFIFLNKNSYCDCIGDDNSNHINNPNFYSNLKRSIKN